MKKVYKLQCDIAKMLKNVIEPAKILPTVIKFCTGDYLNSALRSLYSICYRSPEELLYLYMDILSKRAVSAQKHAVFLSCALLDYHCVINMLKTTKQSNVSNQKHIFSATLKYFLRNPSQDLLDLLISNMNAIDKNDIETLNSFTSINVPKRYQALYVERCWKFYESIRKNVMVHDYLRSLLHTIINSPHIVVSLSSEFCKDIIDNYFKLQIDDLLNMELFVCKVLRYREAEQVAWFDFVFEIISTFKGNDKTELITKFFKMFYSVASKETNAQFVSVFSSYWEQLFTPVEMINEFILLKLLNIKYESAEPFIENYAKNVITFLEELIAEYGLYVYNLFKLLLKKRFKVKFY
ncbi:hypothetical protein NQ314_008724 [Rhamnusium bicolor]|uniref:Uncharacterized protein n=1 Tax=Rhamnusium bicolor TaxID=1586634 RepID=A0AAV8Y7V0_9CUCU|nr:hypothetical protein NQ314_008724 [Rhamnusium bicolor]